MEDTPSAAERFRVPFNETIGFGLIFSFSLGVILGFPFASVMTSFLLVKFVIALTTATVIFILGLHETPLAHRDVVTILGKRYRFGKDGEGLEEGWNWLIPLMMGTISVPITKRERKPMVEVTTRDNIEAKFEVFTEFWVNQPYEYLDVEDAEGMLDEIITHAARTISRQHGAVELRHLDRKTLSEHVRTEILSEFDSEQNKEGVQWGIGIGSVRVPNKIHLPERIEKALHDKVAETHEAEAEFRQTQARHQQIEKLVELGIDPNHAAAITLADAGKAGAEVKSWNVMGLQGGIQSLDRLGRGLETLARPENPPNRNQGS